MRLVFPYQRLWWRGWGADGGGGTVPTGVSGACRPRGGVVDRGEGSGLWSGGSGRGWVRARRRRRPRFGWEPAVGCPARRADDGGLPVGRPAAAAGDAAGREGNRVMIRRSMAFSWRVAILVVVVATGLGTGVFGVVPMGDGPRAAVAGGGYNPDRQECQFLKQINKYRGGGKLTLDANLGAAAVAHSKDQARRDKMFHSNLGQLLRKHSYNGSPTGENVAWGTNLDGGKAVFNAWKKSPSHDRNMRSGSFEAIGIARVEGNRGWYWTTIFGGKVSKKANC